jgi:GMP synthase (glutamine-hydrolysing)
MKPFLLLSIRAEKPAADDEYAAFCRFLDVDASGLHRRQLGVEPLGVLNLDDWSGIILGGGSFTFSDPEESKTPVQRLAERDLVALLDRVVGADFPFLGACYGIGSLGSHQGGLVDRRYPEPVGPLSVTVTDEGLADPLFAGVPRDFAAFGGHKEALSSLPDHAVLLATSAACPVQAFRVGSNVYATQFHPELDRTGIHTRIDVYSTFGYFDPSEAAALHAASDRVDVSHPMTLLANFRARYAR